MPGTEVAVAPKRRKTDVNKQDTVIQSSNKEFNSAKALLRLQDSDRRFFHKSEVKGVELGIVLSSVAYMHPETAKKISLDSHQLVTVVPRLSSKGTMRTPENDVMRTKTSSTLKEINNDTLTDKKEYRQAIVRILFSDSVAKGHLMIAQSLCLYLRVSLHSCMYSLNAFNENSF